MFKTVSITLAGLLALPAARAQYGVPIHAPEPLRIGLPNAKPAAGGLKMPYAQSPLALSTQDVEVVVHNFASPPHGLNPYENVIRDSAGNFYGTTAFGGTYGLGVVFRIDSSGHETVLHSFAGGTDGAYPNSLTPDAAGNLYGTTSGGGASSAGTVFEIARAGQESILYTFTGGTDGGSPQANVVLDSSGNLYGTTSSGGTFAAGVVFKLDAAGHEKVLYTFTGGNDGSYPAAVMRDSSGNLCGVTQYGGAAGAGVVFEVETTGSQTVLYTFTGGTDGGYPFGELIRDSAGNLYGTAQYGGASGAGVVFKVDPSDNETVLYSFSGGNDGAIPIAGLVRDSAGNFYGTTFSGGTGQVGVVFELSPSGSETVLLNFARGDNGHYPFAGVIRDSTGNLYGTTLWGGNGEAGVVYELNAAGQQTILYSFPSVTDGRYPNSPVTLDSAGNVYGTTFYGGAAGDGTVFKLDSQGHETILHAFVGNESGGKPNAGVILDSQGNLYGTATSSPATVGLGNGVVYKVDPSRNYTVLYTFTGGTDGGYPNAGVIRDSSGNLYGTTELGGTSGSGVVYALNPSGNEKVLYSFTGGADGGIPEGGLIRDGDGNLYGTTTYGGVSGAGVVFKVDSSGNETVLYSFTGGTDGANPLAGVVRDSSGNFYGSTFYGGAWGFGVVFKLDTAGDETVPYAFTGGADGANPSAGVIRDSAGDLFGTTNYGGAGMGVVFKVDASGNETVLNTFAGQNGDYPNALTFDSQGNIWGTATDGGSKNDGVVFKLRHQ